MAGLGLLLIAVAALNPDSLGIALAVGLILSAELSAVVLWSASEVLLLLVRIAESKQKSESQG